MAWGPLWGSGGFQGNRVIEELLSYSRVPGEEIQIKAIRIHTTQTSSSNSNLQSS